MLNSAMDSHHQLVDHFTMESVRNFQKALQSKNESALSDRFNPYTENGGTCAGIAGKDFVILSGDTRLSASSMVVMSRTAPKVYRLTPKVYITGTGFQGDMIQLVKVLRTRIQQYLFTFNEYMDIHAAAQLLSRTLYFKRFFPYYVGAIIGGIDRDGRGVLYSYDPVGTIEELPYSAQGEGSYLIEPFFDNQACQIIDLNNRKLQNDINYWKRFQIGWKTQPQQTKQPLSKERAQQLMHDAFISTIEREKSTGDAVQMVILHADKVEEHILKMRTD
ncbi:Proteasome subunit beta type-1-B [Trichinella pseudospiralis]|uniref:Proteasome subunit beta type-1-B n=1 Tax=Trichinella pseudospiralis TaxID=6337 RepID=A0A0V1EDU1_TRIPS|nr:Proteasome subunit beta type-1-B [Trichinella pseudospiralis]KRZ26410.1 Proteasome subunit beta type-1-B [Trichinella pseudospiralis]